MALLLTHNNQTTIKPPQASNFNHQSIYKCITSWNTNTINQQNTANTNNLQSKQTISKQPLNTHKTKSVTTKLTLNTAKACKFLTSNLQVYSTIDPKQTSTNTTQLIQTISNAYNKQSIKTNPNNRRQTRHTSKQITNKTIA